MNTRTGRTYHKSLRNIFIVSIVTRDHFKDDVVLTRRSKDRLDSGIVIQYKNSYFQTRVMALTVLYFVQSYSCVVVTLKSVCH